jgi:hypothetical protein
MHVHRDNRAARASSSASLLLFVSPVCVGLVVVHASMYCNCMASRPSCVLVLSVPLFTPECGCGMAWRRVYGRLAKQTM